ncbi:MAG: cysteine desulfurase family protein [Planctomycetota bacterium]|nr:cysteine desulfurase family protein [Planctomycetota bacterium]
MKPDETIYLDYAATTPVAPQVVTAMLPYLTTAFGNPSSTHAFGRTAKLAVEEARGSIASFLNVKPNEIIFTSGGSESNVLAIKGMLQKKGRGHLILSAVEHPSSLDAAKQLEKQGYAVTLVNPTSEGEICLSTIEDSITNETVLVSVMVGNNEIGTINDVEAMASLCKERGVTFHTDAAQAVGHLPFDASRFDLTTLTGHKLYAPKGVGVLVVKEPSTLHPMIQGGQAERGLRGGTLNVASIVGLGKAIELCQTTHSHSIASVRNCCEALLREQLPSIVINGKCDARLPHISSVQFPSLGPDFSPAMIQGVACSAGSACQSGIGSHVLKAMGKNESEIASTLRLSFGRQTSEDDMKKAVNSIISCVNQCTPRV